MPLVPAPRAHVACSRQTNRDPATSLPLFVDLALPRLTPLLRRDNAPMRSAALRLLYAHCDDSARSHAQAIRALKDALGPSHQSLSCLLMCLAELLSMESALSERLLDVYLYYCSIGLGLPSPTVRANCLRMLADIARRAAAPAATPAEAKGAELVAQQLTVLHAQAADGFWQVRVQLVHVAAELLGALPAHSAARAECLQLVFRVLAPAHSAMPSLHVRLGALPALARQLGADAEVRRLFLQLLLGLPAEERAQLLESPRPLSLEWSPALVAIAMAELADTQQLEHLEVGGSARAVSTARSLLLACRLSTCRCWQRRLPVSRTFRPAWRTGQRRLRGACASTSSWQSATRTSATWQSRSCAACCSSPRLASR